MVQKKRQQRRPLEKALPIVLVALAGTIGWHVWQRAPSPARLLESARQAMDRKQYAAVEKLCGQIAADAPQSANALLLAAEAAGQQEHFSDALGYYDRVGAAAGDDSVAALCAAGSIWLDLDHASNAEAKYRAALEIDRRRVTAHDRLAHLLAVEGRRFESLRHLYELLRQRRYSLDVLLLAGEHAVGVESPAELARFRTADPDDPAPLIGLARIALRKKQYAKAIDLLRRVIAQAPYVEAHALLGRVLLERPNDDDLVRWQADLPAEAELHPDVWAVRGSWAMRRGQKEVAARSFWEALRRDPNHHSATLQLSQVLHALGDSPSAEALGRRAAALAEFSSTLESLNERPNDQVQLLHAARQSELLGRFWEAWGWNQIALSVAPEAAWPRQALARIEPLLDDSLPPTFAAVDPGVQLDLSNYPLPEIHSRVPETAAAPWAPSGAAPRFEDVAGRAGIDFAYFCGREGTSPRMRMFQAFGGGIAVIDYDLDGWPDLYFTQGCRWPPRPGQTEFLDCLDRNLGSGRFEQVTLPARLGDERFSGGATVGDFNNDGFPDLYVANIGANRLYVNHGDGTFDDVTEAAGIRDGSWTTSCALADFSGDGLPDLYDVNYVQAPDVFERICSTNGVPGTCRPSAFEPAPDRLYVNQGDGRFLDATETAGVRVAGGNGLGIVAADFDATGRLSIFVANDQDANFYFLNRTPAGGKKPAFEERGLLSGLAYDGEGRTLASMGVAAGDVNGDGKIDLLVTNFQEESSTLYVQLDGESFTDATGPAGLREPSFAMLGFGTQFIDAELDGLPDLVVANGHVHEFSSPGVSNAMRPQYFRNLGRGRFEELTSDSLGAYFQQKCFGRSLARLDFNRDGREDFAVSSLEAPIALVTNRTPGAGHFLAVQLRGVRSGRDAIGAVVHVEIGRRRQTQWLNAGDGYQASNQRQLVFGLGEARRVDKLEIAWPSGIHQQFRDLDVDQELILVEGSAEVTVVPAASVSKTGTSDLSANVEKGKSDGYDFNLKSS